MGYATNGERPPLGQLIRFLRTEVLELAREQFGEVAGVSGVSVWNWESGEKAMALGTMQALLAGLSERGIDWLDLDDLINPDVDKARAKWRRDAAVDAVGEDAPAADRILAYLRALEGGATDDEIADDLGLKSSTVSRARRRLVVEGLVVELEGVGLWGASA